MSGEAHPRSRLSLWQAALVIARRDFTAVLFSRSFLFFLLGPLFPILVGGLAGGIGNVVQQETSRAQIGVMMAQSDTDRLMDAFERLRPQLGRALPPLVPVSDEASDGGRLDAGAILEQRRGGYAAIVGGTPERPVLTGPADQVQRWKGPLALLAATAQQQSPSTFPEIATQTVATSAADERSDRIATAQASQMLLFLLTMLLAGMVLSNLVEEKTNKIIEILAAAIPMDAVFLGKLFAMLGVSLVGIAVWTFAGFALAGAAGGGLRGFAPPAVGWPIFFAFAVLYFSMAYLLLGSLFLMIGSLAATVREVQTLSMPVTMMQLLVFFFASYAVAKPGTWVEYAAIVFPWSSPFAMLARAAQSDALWPHLAALAWQALAIGAMVRLGAALFRRWAMKSGPGAPKGNLLSRWRRNKSQMATGY